jgi:hypothetical protein
MVLDQEGRGQECPGYEDRPVDRMDICVDWFQFVTAPHIRGI